MAFSLSASALERFLPSTYLPPLGGVEGDTVNRALAGELLQVHHRIDRLYSTPDQHSDFSVYTGTAGVAYMYWNLATCDDNTIPMNRDDLLGKATAFIDSALRTGKQSDRKSTRVSTFLTGMAGVYSIAAAIHTSLNKPSAAAAMVNQVIGLASRALQQGVPSELLYGRTGYLSCLLFLAANAGLQLRDHAEVIGRIVQAILSDGKSLAGGGFPLMWEWHDSKYLGAAHGVCGILTVLLHLREVVDAYGASSLVRGTIDRLMDARNPSGNLPSSLGKDKDVLVHWCHGAPGLVPLLCLAHEMYKDEKYLEAARKAAGQVAERGLLRKGFGICHGISGNGLALLCMDRFDKSGGYGNTALQFGLFACQPQCADVKMALDIKQKLLEQPDSGRSLMEGDAGLGCFLGALLQGRNAKSTMRLTGAAAPWLM